MKAWAVGAGITFLALAVLAVWRKSKGAGIAFLVLFLVSTAASCVRIAEGLRDLH